jgi:hypothetical protein
VTRSSPAQLSFSSGEISPLLAGRPDYQRYQTGLATCRGFIPLRQGGFTRAPGTWWRGNTRNNARGRAIGFQFAVNDAVVLEFTNLRMRVWRYGELVQSLGVPYELVTPYNTAALDRLQWVQSADVIYLADGVLPIQKLSRFALDSWTIAAVNFTNGPFRVPNLTETITVQASAATGAAITLTGVGNPFAADMVGSLVQLEPVDFSAVALWTGNQAIAPGDIVTYGGNIYECTGGLTTGVNPPIHTSGTRLYDRVAGTTWKFLNDGTGIVRITAFTNANLVTASVVKRLPSPVVTDPTYRFALGAWSARHGYPTAIEIHEQRLVAAATPTDPRTVWFSAAGGLEDFEPSTEPDGSFAYAIAGKSSLNRILWLQTGKRGLHIGALGEEYSSRSTTGGTAIAATTAIFGFDTSYGSRPIRPIAPDGKPIFITRDGKRVVELGYAFESDGNVPRELSLPSEHIGQGGFDDIIWQSAPLRLCWLRRSAGDLAVMVYDPAEDVLGWATYPVAGGVVESFAVTTSADGEADILTLFVRRTVNGLTVRFVEEQAVTYGVIAGDDPISEANHLFAAARFAPGAPATDFAVPHLAGQSVYAWTDAGEFGPLTVPATGTLTLPDAVNTAIIGLLDSTHAVEMLDIPAPARDGLSLGRKKRINRGTGMTLHRTSGGKVRSKVYELSRPTWESKWEDLIIVPIGNDATQAYSGPIQSDIVTEAARRLSIEFVPSGAKPMTVLAVVPRIEEVGA